MHKDYCTRGVPGHTSTGTTSSGSQSGQLRVPVQHTGSASACTKHGKPSLAKPIRNARIQMRVLMHRGNHTEKDRYTALGTTAESAYGCHTPNSGQEETSTFGEWDQGLDTPHAPLPQCSYHIPKARPSTNSNTNKRNPNTAKQASWMALRGA